MFIYSYKAKSLSIFNLSEIAEASNEKTEFKRALSEKPKINSKAGENIIEKEKIESGTVIISKQNKQFISSYI
jgi:hypothetical protein